MSVAKKHPTLLYVTPALNWLVSLVNSVKLGSLQHSLSLSTATVFTDLTASECLEVVCALGGFDDRADASVGPPKLKVIFLALHSCRGRMTCWNHSKMLQFRHERTYQKRFTNDVGKLFMCTLPRSRKRM